MDKLLIEITTHYPKEDTEFQDDYCSIDLKLTDTTTGYIIFEKSYGDEYHEKGKDRVEAVKEFIETAFKEEYEIQVVTTNLADI